jgi:hypothetical protein
MEMTTSFFNLLNNNGRWFLHMVNALRLEVLTVTEMSRGDEKKTPQDLPQEACKGISTNPPVRNV